MDNVAQFPGWFGKEGNLEAMLPNFLVVLGDKGDLEAMLPKIALVNKNWTPKR